MPCKYVLKSIDHFVCLVRMCSKAMTIYCSSVPHRKTSFRVVPMILLHLCWKVIMEVSLQVARPVSKAEVIITQYGSTVYIGMALVQPAL